MTSMQKTKINKNLGLLILSIIMLVYVLFAVSSELTGDYLVYWDMYLNGSLESFDNQPIFTAYFEMMRGIAPFPELFFTILILPWFIAVSRIYFNELFIIHPVPFCLLLTVFCAFILQPSMVVFLLRQNLAILIFLTLLPTGIWIASILSIGVHYSFAPILLISYAVYTVMNKTQVASARAIYYVIAIFILIMMRTQALDLLAGLPMVDISVIDNYITLYNSYDDVFPDFTALKVFVLIGSIVYIIWQREMSVRYKWIGALTTTVFLISMLLSFSDPLSYRFLQVAKLPALILIMWFFCGYRKIKTVKISSRKIYEHI